MGSDNKFSSFYFVVVPPLCSVSFTKKILFFLNYAVATRDLAHSSVYPCMSDFAEISWFSHHLQGGLLAACN